MRVTGEGLSAARMIVFLGVKGNRDDRRARAQVLDDHTVTVTVPRRARSGRLLVLAHHARGSRRGPVITIAPGRATAPRVRPGGPVVIPGKVFQGGAPAVYPYTLAPGAAATVELFRAGDGGVVRSWPVTGEPDGAGEQRWDGRLSGVPAAPGRYGFRLVGGQTATAAQSTATEFDLLDAIFPIRGEHDLGRSPANDFGGGRGHMGQDLFAACGTPLVAARGGEVSFVDYHRRAGHYAVITDADGQSQVYMHLRRAPLVKKGDTLLTGQPIGEVGASGRADGCHLHFELWSAPGWYQGGKAVDPLPDLQRWDAAT